MFSTKPSSSCGALLLAALATGSSGVSAQTSAQAPSAVAVPAADVSAAPTLNAMPKRGPFGAAALPAAALATRRGADGVINQNRLKGVVADNSASNLTTGMNVISEGAFAGSQGLPMVIQNSGNNVLIQNSTIVNVQVK